MINHAMLSSSADCTVSATTQSGVVKAGLARLWHVAAHGAEAAHALDTRPNANECNTYSIHVLQDCCVSWQV